MLQDLRNQAEGNSQILWYVDNVINKYINEENNVSQSEMEHIVDYFKHLERKGKKLKIKKMAIEDAIRLSKQWTEKMIKKASNIIETEEDVEVIKVFKSEGLRLVKLVGENSFKREGKLMSHCVGSYYGRNDVIVYSVRDENNNPHCTLEVQKNNKYINQVKGKGNGPIHPRYIKTVMKSLKLIGVEVRESELEYLGYKNLSKAMWNILDGCYIDVKYLTFNNKRFYYINQNKLYLNPEVSEEKRNKIVKKAIKENKALLIEAITNQMPIESSVK